MAVPRNDAVMTVAEVAATFRVDRKTVTRWVRAGKMVAFRTPGNHMRFYRSHVMAVLRGERP